MMLLQSITSSGQENASSIALLAATAGAAVVVAAATAAYYAQTNKKTKDVTNGPQYPPGPIPNSWLLGNALQLPDTRKSDGTHISLTMLEWSKIYGRIFTFVVPVIGRTIVIAHPTLAKYVLVTKNYPKSFTYGLYDDLFGKTSMVLGDSNDEWKGKRKAFATGFTPNFLKSVVTVISNKMIRFINAINNDIQSNQITNLLHRSQTFTADVIVQVAFGEDWGTDGSDDDHDGDSIKSAGDDLQTRRDWLTELMIKINRKANDPLGTLFDFKLKRRIKELAKLLDGEMMNVLERRISQMKANQQKKKKNSGEDKDILSIAIQHYQNKNDNRDRDNNNDLQITQSDKIAITHQLKTFYFAGHDTTAAVISWSIWLLSQHPEELKILRNEIEQHELWKTATRTNTKAAKKGTSTSSPPIPPPTYEQLQQCEYLDAVIKETLRLYPPANTGRYVDEDVWTDPDTGVSYKLGPATLFVDMYALHRHPDNFKNPDAFVPNRFLDGSEDNLDTKFLGFSKGPRDCIGKYFAMLEAKLAISRLVTLYDFECVRPLAGPNEEEFIQQVTGLPRYGCEVKLSHRKTS